MPDEPDEANDDEVDDNKAYALGTDLSEVPDARDTPAADLQRLLNVESANPFLQQRRIEEGFLSRDLPVEGTDSGEDER